MKYNKINGEHFYNMVVNASNRLEEQKEFVNSLNVFPVPDGDTGTNMSATFKAAVAEIENFKNPNLGQVAKKLAKGALMGARGNSGVILSQILRGISKGLEDKEQVDASQFAEALMEGSKSAYKAVMRPIEGTILTIIRVAGESALKSNQSDITKLMEEVCHGAKDALNKTPDMLPVLKSAKVVDSGGMGLLIILNGMLEALTEGIQAKVEEVKNFVADNSAANSISAEDIKFGYCTEFIILGDASKADKLKNEIESMGDSMIVVGYEDVIKVHIHTNDPGMVLSKAVQVGELSKIKIDNMREEHRNLVLEEKEYAKEEVVTEEAKEYAFVSVAMGEGIKNIFNDLGVDYVIEGGQTMNPSTQDIVEAIKSINAKNVFILPNNKNIIMSSNQAVELSDKNVVVVPTTTIPQGITCLTVFNPEETLDNNIKAMKDSIANVKSGSVTYAVRDTEMDGIKISEGDILGLQEGKIKQVGKSLYNVTEELIDKLVDDDSELITLFYGKDAQEEEVGNFVSTLEEKYSHLDIQYYKGEQPLYYFIIAVE